MAENKYSFVQNKEACIARIKENVIDRIINYPVEVCSRLKYHSIVSYYASKELSIAGNGNFNWQNSSIEDFLDMDSIKKEILKDRRLEIKQGLREEYLLARGREIWDKRCELDILAYTDFQEKIMLQAYHYSRISQKRSTDKNNSEFRRMTSGEARQYIRKTIFYDSDLEISIPPHRVHIVSEKIADFFIDVFSQNVIKGELAPIDNFSENESVKQDEFL